jgi:hypothetical protein
MYPSDKQTREEFDRHYSLAIELLDGTKGPDRRGVNKRVFLSANTKPTEEEARRALCRILRYWERCTGANLLGAIANVFDPNGNGERKVVFQKLTQGHNDPVRDDEIADMVWWQLHDFRYMADRDESDIVRNNTKVREAHEAVGKRVGLTAERVKKICARVRKQGRQLIF